MNTLEIILVLMASAMSSHAISIRPIGDPINVWRAIGTLHECGFVDVPDIPPRVFTDPSNITHIIAGSTTYRHMNGPSILDVRRSCDVAWNMTGDPRPSRFAANEFLDSSVMFENGTVVALVHTEYPGNRYPHNNCSEGFYPHCWTVTVGLAISHNFGDTWDHVRPPPHHLVASLPYRFNESELASGWGDPSNIVLRDGWYYVALWNRNKVGKQDAGICFARTQDLLDPASWRGYSGNGDFDAILSTSPYEGEIADIRRHICTVVNLPVSCAVFSLSWSVFLDSFVAVLGCMGPMSKAFHISASRDLVEWSDPQPIYSRDDLPDEIQRNVTSMMYPAFIDALAPTEWDDPNYSTIGRTPHLYWTSIGHSPYVDGRSLWATPFQFSNCDSPTSNH